ncbi:hypothetical protein [Sphingobacterium multivorum]|uniref:hypothetical protein n=1 Tax=Sphingobacterium multivorum TaxID=28454 RepID=UPI003DA1E673
MTEETKEISDRKLLESIYQLQIITFQRVQHLEKMLEQLGASVPFYCDLDYFTPTECTVENLASDFKEVEKVVNAFPQASEEFKIISYPT